MLRRMHVQKQIEVRSCKADMEKINKDVEEFLANGGKIKKIPEGQAAFDPKYARASAGYGKNLKNKSGISSVQPPI